MIVAQQPLEVIILNHSIRLIIVQDNQLRRPRKPIARANHGNSHNKYREPQGQALSAVWFEGWEACFHGLGKGWFVHLLNGKAVANLAVGAVKGD